MATLRLVGYLNGTKQDTTLPTEGQTSIANVLNAVTPTDGETQVALCLPGCATTNAAVAIDMGGAFANSLNDQISKIVNPIIKMTQAGHTVELILYAYSRGVIAALEAAIQLQRVNVDQLTIDIVAVDPVSGNLSMTATAASVVNKNLTWTTKIADMSACTHIKNVHVIFASDKPGETLDNATLDSVAQDCYDAILPAFAKTTKVTVNVTPGKHGDLNKFNIAENVATPASNNSLLVIYDVMKFLKARGVVFNDETLKIVNTDIVTVNCAMLTELQKITAPDTRDMHLDNGITITPDKEFLNFVHQQLMGHNDPSTCALTIKNPRPTGDSVHQFLTQQRDDTIETATELAKMTLSGLSNVEAGRQPTLVQSGASMLLGWINQATAPILPSVQPQVLKTDVPEEYEWKDAFKLTDWDTQLETLKQNDDDTTLKTSPFTSQ